MSAPEGLAARQRAWFDGGEGRPLEARLAALTRLEEGVRRSEGALLAALHEDLGKSAAEGYMTEIGTTLEEIALLRCRLRAWTRPRRVRVPLAQFPARGYVLREPYGAALLLAPWNYPVQLTLVPLAAALAAGCTAAVKPSAYAPATSRALAALLGGLFPPGQVCVVEGGREENAALLAQKWDCIFFTGSTAVGKVVLHAAAEHLTPCTLELGGKSPCIVTDSADLPLAARRIAFGKLLNAGQTCVAPDYVLADARIKDAFVAHYCDAVRQLYPTLEDFPRIVNDRHYARLLSLLEGEHDALSLPSDRAHRLLAPAVLDRCTWHSPAMGEEIFGPLLPVLAYERLPDALARLRALPRPLACYLFTADRALARQVLGTLSFGGGCLNDAVVHLACPNLPFGGVGESGMGAYHGRESLRAFSREKSVLVRGRLDLPMRYPPFSERKLSLIRRFLG